MADIPSIKDSSPLKVYVKRSKQARKQQKTVAMAERFIIFQLFLGYTFFLKSFL